MHHFWKKIAAHKFLTFIIVLAVGGGGYWAYKKATVVPAQAQYVLGAAAKGTLIISVSGSGQVSAASQVDVKPKASGQVLSLPVREGQSVGVGAALAYIDSTNAQKAVRDAQVNLESAQLSLTKLQQSGANISAILEDSFATMSNAFLDFPAIIASAEDVIAGSTIAPGRQNNVGYYKDFVGQQNDANYQKINLFVDSALNDYTTARTAYDAVLLLYKNTTRSSAPTEIQTLLNKTLDTTKALAKALQSEQNLLDFLSDYAITYSKTLPNIITTYKTNLRTYIGQVNGHLSNLSGATSNIANAPLDIQSSQLSIKQRENSLADAKTALADYTVRAPFSGVIAKMTITKGDDISASTIVATMITTQRIATVSLNEVDVAKVSVGQKATLTFDAVSGLTISGQVQQVDAIGAVSQGVVTYNVKIGFDTQDVRIKPGMSASAAIITSAKPDVLLVPSGAVKTQGQTKYVQILDASGLPFDQTVEVGASNDVETEITSGLKDGDKIVVRTIAATAAGAATAQTAGIGGIRIPGVTGGGGNTFRAGTTGR